MSIRINPEFKALIPPLSPEEFKQLEKNCVRDGIRDALMDGTIFESVSEKQLLEMLEADAV